MNKSSPNQVLPVGKLPLELQERLLASMPARDDRLMIGPGIGLDCAVIQERETLMVLKSDPITFATNEIGWYLVQVNANDIATTGAVPRWMLLTMLLPANAMTAGSVEKLSQQVYQACQEIGISIVGGHTEITSGLSRPILIGTMIGEVNRENLITPRGATSGDRLLLTKGVPIEATALIAREFPDQLKEILSQEELGQAQDYLYHPGISILPEVHFALNAGRVTAMHDPTEGGLAMALWELAEASQHTILFQPENVPIPPLSARICRFFNLDPLAAIASGALLFTAPPGDALKIQQAIVNQGIPCVEIGAIEDGPASVWQETSKGRQPYHHPDRDEIAKLF